MKKTVALLLSTAYSASTKSPAPAVTVTSDSHASAYHSADLDVEIPTIHYIKTFEFNVIPLDYRDPHKNDPVEADSHATTTAAHRVLGGSAATVATTPSVPTLPTCQASGSLPCTTEGYGMKVDFTISRQKAGDNTKFDVILGIYPPADYSWVSGHIYQSYIQFNSLSEQGTKQNVVCDATYNSNPLYIKFNHRISCGTVNLSTFSLSKPYSGVKGESISACADVWTLDPLSNFFVDSDGNKDCLCAFSRSFEVGTGVSLKVGSVLSFTAGFNEFASATSVGALAYGKSNQWSWTVTDSASIAFLSVFSLISFSLFTF